MTPHALRRAFGLAAVVAAAAFVVPAEAAPSDAARRLVERAAAALARAGRVAEMREAIALLPGLGTDAAALVKFRDACDKTASKATKAAEAVPEAAKCFRQAAAELASALEAAPPAEREALARSIVALDGRHVAAHRALGHLQHDGQWVTPEMPACLVRRRELADAARIARTLPVEFESGESPIESIRRVTGKKGIFVRANGIALHSARWPRDKLERILAHTLRACALSEAARGRELRIPTFARGYDYVVYAEQADYARAVAEALENGGIDRKTADRTKHVAVFWDFRGPCVGWRNTEADWEADVFYDLFNRCAMEQYGGLAQPCLTAGHVNWVLLQFVGRGIPRIAWIEEETKRVPDGTTSDRRLEDERKELFRLSKNSLAGARAWLQWLARRGEDPPWSRAMLDEVGKVTGNELTKSTFVAEYLHESGRWEDVCKTTQGREDRQTAFEEALAESLGEFERRWRAWFLPLEPGLAERVEGAPPGETSPADLALLAYLDKLRAAAVWSRDRKLVPPLRLDDELSAGCRLHAGYLGKHRDQLARWPDAHEEYPDREGFTAQGCRAGLSSVIAPGVLSAQDAVDGWMGTFYHRLPLLDPGLLRIGWAMDGGVAVLDAGSMVAQMPIGTWCTWPPPGARDVPRRFSAELPNPVPGADQSQWGYPVTAQFFSWGEMPEVRLRLLLAGAAVDCHVSTPDAPSNPDLAPAGAFCLIPKATLQPNAVYTVMADGVPQMGRLEWTFTTGK